MDIDIRGPSDIYEGEVIVRIYEEHEGRTHSAGVSVKPENARILKAAPALYKAFAAARHALEIAEGDPRPPRMIFPDGEGDRG